MLKLIAKQFTKMSFKKNFFPDLSRDDGMDRRSSVPHHKEKLGIREEFGEVRSRL